MSQSLMPQSATALEKAFDLAAAKHIAAIPVERIFDQWHPERCPAELLGWLAWAVSVDDWNPDWPESVKRDVIAASISVHRHKGTRHSVDKALASLTINTEVSEWQQQADRRVPYSFTVKAFANSTLNSEAKAVLDQDFYQLVKRQINNTKPVRSQFDIQVGAAFSQQISTAMTLGVKQPYRYCANLKSAENRFQSALGLASHASTSALSRKRLTPKTDASLNHTGAAIASKSRATDIVRQPVATEFKPTIDTSKVQVGAVTRPIAVATFTMEAA